MFKNTYYMMGAALTVGMIGTSREAAAGSTGTSGNNFSNIAENITTSLQDIPGLISAISYLFGVLIGVLGILKIKDHVENPTQTPLKDGAIRLAAGGALFALPIIFESMSNTLGDGTTVEAAQLKKVEFTTL